ncbi:hypothetical protein FRC17_008990 [Serendipita sp. 399]|nr:hypothetical protein FRC17_008990 [Serendipita sp. 399]
MLNQADSLLQESATLQAGNCGMVGRKLVQRLGMAVEPDRFQQFQRQDRRDETETTSANFAVAVGDGLVINVERGNLRRNAQSIAQAGVAGDDGKRQLESTELVVQAVEEQRQGEEEEIKFGES